MFSVNEEKISVDALKKKKHTCTHGSDPLTDDRPALFDAASLRLSALFARAGSPHITFDSVRTVFSHHEVGEEDDKDDEERPGCAYARGGLANMRALFSLAPKT